jgi:protein TonB
MSPTSVAVLVCVAAAHLGVAVYLYSLHAVPSRLQAQPDSPPVIIDLPMLQPATPHPQVRRTPERPLPVHVEDQVKLQADQTIKVAPPPQQPQLADLGKPAALTDTVTVPPAQPIGPKHLITDPRWASQPTADEFTDAYPPRAELLGKTGRVVLLCTVLASGDLTDCGVAEETPSGWGFGAAALRLAKRFRLVPREEDGSPVGGAMVRIPITFALRGE